MELGDDFFVPETKLGFPISELMKRCWAAQLKILEIFDTICRKYHIKYYIAYGTLLGAVRHKGFIQWDDDIDLWMFREDLNILMCEAVLELKKEGLEFVTPYNDKSYNNLCFRIINTRTTCIDDEFLIKYFYFPFIAGLDIFPLDYVPQKKEEVDFVLQLARAANYLAKNWNNDNGEQDERLSLYYELAGLLNIKTVEENVDNELWKLTDRICSLYTEEDTDRVACYAYFSQDESKIFQKKWFQEIDYLEFENLSLPAPLMYKEVLQAEFGADYMIPKQVEGEHEYPYYKRQQKAFLEMLEKKGIACPELLKM